MRHKHRGGKSRHQSRRRRRCRRQALGPAQVPLTSRAASKAPPQPHPKAVWRERPGHPDGGRWGARGGSKSKWYQHEHIMRTQKNSPCTTNGSRTTRSLGVRAPMNAHKQAIGNLRLATTAVAVSSIGVRRVSPRRGAGRPTTAATLAMAATLAERAPCMFCNSALLNFAPRCRRLTCGGSVAWQIDKQKTTCMHSTGRPRPHM